MEDEYPSCGSGHPGVPAKITHVTIWAFHEEDNNLVPERISREMIDAIKKARGQPEYTEYPDAGHNIWNQVVSTPGLMDCLFEQKRDWRQRFWSTVSLIDVRYHFVSFFEKDIFNVYFLGIFFYRQKDYDASMP